MTPSANNAKRKSHLQYDTGTRIKEVFPCINPDNTDMRNYSDRLRSFALNPLNVAAKAEEFADAGFFREAIGDRVQCFSCNGRLENWMYTDDPMVEHAKWYPGCEYIIRKRGRDFVNAIANTFPDLSRPTALRSVVSSSTVFQVEGLDVSQNTTTTDIQPSRLGNRVDEYIEHELTKTMIEFGFSDDVVKKVLERRLMTSGMFESATDFLEAIQQFENETNQQMLVSGSQDTIAKTSKNSEPRPATASNAEMSVDEKISELKRLHTCKICFEKETSCVLHPCGHLCVCMDCARQLKKCPICRTKVKKILKIYVA